MMRKYLLLILVGMVLNACVPAPTPIVPTQTSTSTPQPTATETIVWFPATETPLPTPTQENTPTPLVIPEVGEVIFRDDFSNSEDWILPENNRGEINISGSEINVVINEPRTYLLGYREKPDLMNFFVQITANPSLCNGRDEYGLLFRVIGPDTYYRLSLSCDGQVRFEKIIAGSVFTIQPWMRSASVPVGAPSKSTIEVLAKGGEIRIFVNGALQYSGDDYDIQAGSVGVFARSTSETAQTVSFSNLVVRELLLE